MDGIDPDRVLGELTELAVESAAHFRAYSLASFSAPVVTLRYR
jgi:hypothetical protein